MPRIPGAEAFGQQPVPRPADAVIPYQVGDAGVALPGLAVAGMGSKLNQTADELYVAAEREQLRIDNMRVEDAFNLLRQKQFELTYGEKGFTQRKGANAIDPKLYEEQGKVFDTEVKNITTGLANDRQKSAFATRARVSGLQFKEQLLRHQAHETDRYGKEVMAGTIKTETGFAEANWQDGTAVLLSKERINRAIDARGQAEGWSKEMLDATKLEAMQQLNRGVIQQALGAGNFRFAEDYRDANKDAVDPATSAAVSRAAETGVQRELTNGYNAEFIAGRNSMKALDDLYGRIGKDQKLDEGHKNMLMGRIDARRTALAHQAEIAQNRWERKVEQQVNALTQLTLQGYEPTIEQIQPLLQATKGTAYEPVVQGVVNQANAMRAFRQSSPLQQEAAISSGEALVRTNPTPANVAMLRHMGTIHESQKKEAADSPLSFALRQGLVEPGSPGTRQIDLAKPDSQEMAARIGLARAVASRYNVPLKPLTEEEASVLKRQLISASPAQKVEYFARLKTSVGDDMDGYKAVMRQVADDNPVTAMAGVHAAQGRSTLATTILRGQAILHPVDAEGKPEKGKTWPMPAGKDEATMERAFANYEGGAFTGKPDWRKATYDAARAIYAEESARVGDASGNYNAKRWQDAMKQATGGVEAYRSSRVVVPHGMTPEEFRKGVNDRLTVIDSNGRLAKGMSVDKLKDVPLFQIRDQQYVFRTTGGDIVLDKNGKPVLIDFSVPAVVPSGFGRKPTPPPADAALPEAP